MGKSKHNISNWKEYNQALVQRGSLTGVVNGMVAPTPNGI
jgi:hypothetical protein